MSNTNEGRRGTHHGIGVQFVCVITALVLAMPFAGADRKAKGTKEMDGKAAPSAGLPERRELFTLTNANGLVAKISTYGAILTELHVPDKNGKSADVVLGFDKLDAYLAGHPYFGATVGRVANRIAKGKFSLDGKEYTLATNNGPNALHAVDQDLTRRYGN